MIDPSRLVADLKQQVLALEDDLRERIELPQFAEVWKREHHRAVEKNRTAATYTAWADDRITQAAVSWALTTAFVRFCEDNRLLTPVWISGPPERRQEAMDAQLVYFRAHPEHTDREWVDQAIYHLARTPATAGLVDDQAMLHTVSPSGQAVTRLLEFWRRTDDSGRLVHDFTDADLDTRFLGDLYQDLSDHAKKTFALLQTPEFVEEFILDRTLTPALADRPLEGFKLIDPACGSGHFLLGAFQRLLSKWDAEAPGLGPRERVQKALDAVWGVDVNAFAVAIAQFRLLVAALQATGETSLEKAPDFRINVLVGDSLWFSHDQAPLPGTLDDDFAYTHEQRSALHQVLTRGQYDAVVANPPYITVKDKALNAGYRERYNHLKGKYQLTAPFMELLFKLAKRGNGGPAGWVGQITSNAFMKREFGVPMIEELLANLDLRLVVDTSGAYIPGHGTPTVIIVGRNQSPVQATVRTILGVRGEPGRPADARTGLVWTSIQDHFDAAGYSDTWITVADLACHSLEKHPWSLAGGAAPQLSEAIAAATRSSLGSHVESIGFAAITGEDAAFVGEGGREPRSWSRDLVPTRPFVEGEAVRDFRISSGLTAAFPYRDGRSISTLIKTPSFWPFRTTLAAGLAFGQTRADKGMATTDYILPNATRLAADKLLTFAFVATHNHFVLDRGGKVFKQSAPVIKLPAEASEDDHLKLLGVLNSSTACFWLKQNSHNKGRPGAEAAGADEPWEHRFEFTGTTLQDFPLPRTLPLERARTLDRLAQELSAQQVGTLIAHATPTGDLLRQAQTSQFSLRRRMVAEQEELDWEVYELYGLMAETLTYGGEAPEVGPGERAFSIVLARAVEAGEVETSWFSHWNHGFPMVTEIPAHWPADYRALVQRRIDAIESVDAIRLLEAPEYKRRWASEPFAQQADKALRGWLLDRLEDTSLWFNRSGQVTPQSVAQLADRLGRDEEFRGVVELWQGHRDIDLVKALTSLLEPEAVPYLAAYRLKDPGLRKFADWQRTWDLQRKEDAGEPVGQIPVPPKYTSADFRKPAYWSARGKLDVPKERFILYPAAGRETDPTPLLGWAGWDHAQQALALATIIGDRQREGAEPATLVALVAGLAELQPWVDQWHAEVDPTYGVSLAAVTGEALRSHMQGLGVTHDDLNAWRPAPTTRGRRPKK